MRVLFGLSWVLIGFSVRSYYGPGVIHVSVFPPIVWGTLGNGSSRFPIVKARFIPSVYYWGTPLNMGNIKKTHHSGLRCAGFLGRRQLISGLLQNLRLRLLFNLHQYFPSQINRYGKN
jgi:hypothetical protein